MENKNSRNGLIYVFTIIVSIIVYLVIHLYCNGLRDDIYKENSIYENNLNKQPINNIIAKKEDKPINVEKIKLNISQITMTAGSKKKIIAIVEPYNASNKNLIWSSSDPSIVTVDKNGKITALKEGKVTITVTTKDGSVKATIVVIIEPVKVEKIILNPTKMTLKVNSSGDIVAVTKPDEAIIDELIWESSDPSIATVDNNGKVFGKNVGTTIITARTPDGKVKATCEVTIINETIPVSNIKLNPTSISIKVDATAQLLTIIEPENATERDVTFTSNDPSIVKVDKNGKITGVNVGTATITVTTKDGKTATCIVTVEPIEVNEIILNTNDLTVKVGNTEQLIAYIDPDDATDKELVWTSSNPYIASVDSTGKVTGVAAGEVTITVTTKDGKVKAECTVTVEDKMIDDEIIFTYDYEEGNYIYLINQFPIKDEVGKSLQGDKHTNDFKLRMNERATGVKYTITIEKLDGSDLDERWAKIFLVNDGVDVANCYRSTNRVKTFNEYQTYNGNEKERILYEGVVSSAEALRGYKDFTLRMWISEDLKLNNSNYLSETKTFKARINVYATE